jgi:predicted lipid-binding transport protein (Tim44 family)
MNNAVVQLIILAGIAIFLILKLRSVLGTRDGFEGQPVESRPQPLETQSRRSFEVIDGGPDDDITDHVSNNPEAVEALTAMKRVEPSFSVGEFLQGARGAYEMILMAFENGDLESVKPYLAKDVFDAFVDVVGKREDEGLHVEATFGGVRETTLVDATFDRGSNLAEISVRLVGELSSVVKDAEGRIVEGDPNAMKKQKDVWTFGRTMGNNDPNWQLVATEG